MLKNIREKLYRTKVKMQKPCDKLLGPFRRIPLKNRDFTIISCNCWDWGVYSRYQLPYSSPTTNLLFPPRKFLKFISDIPHYLNEELVQIDLESFHYRDYVLEREKKGGWGKKDPRKFVYARLGDVDFVAWHYNTFEEVKEKWDRRKKRVNYDKMLFKMHDLWECSFEEFKEYLRLTEGKNALFLTAKKEWKEYASSNPNVIFIERFEKIGYMVDDVHHYVLPFNLTKYLNELWPEDKDKNIKKVNK